MAIVGQSIGMIDSHDRVTGQIDYVLNFELPAMLVGRILRSPLPHARILRIDASRAERLPGVAAILTRADFETGLKGVYGRVFSDQTVVAKEKIRFVGDPVAAVAAVDEDIADEALSFIEVEYEELPTVFDPEEALKPDAPLVHEPRPQLQPAFAGLISKPAGAGNVCSLFKLRRGDVDLGFAEADFVFEDTFRSPAVQHVSLEPHVTVAQYVGGILTIWTSTQMPHAIRAQMSDLFNLPQTRVRIITQTLGGGFGSKGSLRLEPITSFLAWKARRPVKITLRREEEFVTVTKHPTTVHLKTGVTRDGLLVARQVTTLFNTGAYTDIGPVVARNGGSVMSGPYKTPHVKIDSYTIWTNAVPAGALRGFGVPQATWAYESQMDMIAERVGMDPMEFRRKNILHDGDRFATGEVLKDLHYDELLNHAAAFVNWNPDDARWLKVSSTRSTNKAGRRLQRGKAVTAVIKATITPSTSTAAVMLNEDGSLNVLTSSVELGQGAKTALAQIAADAAHVPLAVVRITEPDTDVTPYDQQTSSSRTTFSMGSAIVLAAGDLKRQLAELSGELLEVSVDDLVMHDGKVEVRGAPERSLSYGEIVRKGRRGNLIGNGTFTTRGGLDQETGQGIGSVHWHQAAAACEVEVDTETGKVRILKLNSSVFAGRMVNPRLCELQTEGSTFFGLGQALFEEMVYDDNGHVINSNLGDYMIPSFKDGPDELNVSILEHEENGEIHGIGETSLPPVVPVIANAVYNAVGVRITDLPLTPEKILRGLEDKHKTDKMPE
ncbi:MAG: xanthine dehydrogenase family protein molybdopterin-binding subunit [Deltaproteobacteria bacterium]|nr:xanthine dehydrogenase family protein molybdopterin-binding subunit [Deltaproteobacteria bacterium]